MKKLKWICVVSTLQAFPLRVLLAMCTAARGGRPAQTLVEPQDVTPSDSHRAGCYWASLENYQNDELVVGSGFDLWASTYINSDTGNYGEEQSHCVKDTRDCLQVDWNPDTERHLQK